MTNNLNQYISTAKEDIMFINLKNDINLFDITISANIPIPMHRKELESFIEKNIEPDINLENMLNAILILIVVDSNFEYNNTYLKIIKRLMNEKPGLIQAYLEDKINYEVREKNSLYSTIYSFSRLMLLGEDYDNYHKDLYKHGLIMEENYTKNNDIKGFFLEGKETFLKLTMLDKDNPLYFFHLGFFYMNEGHFLNAEKIFLEAIKKGIDEERYQCINELLLVNKEQIEFEKSCEEIFTGDVDKGLESLLKMEKEKDLSSNGYLMIGCGFKKLKDYKSALYYFEKALPIGNDKDIILNEMGLAYCELDKYPMAIKSFNAALTFKENVEILTNLGAAYYSIGEDKKALDVLAKALQLDKDDELAGVIYSMTKERISKNVE